MSSVALSEIGGHLSKLPDKQRRFVAEYLVDHNGSRAVVAAGYSKNQPSTQAAKLLKNPRIARIIGKIEKEDIEDLKLDRLEVLKQLYFALTRTLDDFCDESGRLVTDITKLSERAKNTVDGIEQEIYTDHEGNQTIKNKLRLIPKAKIIEMAMKHKGLFEPGKVDMTVRGGDPWAIIQDQMYEAKDTDDPVQRRIEEAKS